MGFNRIEEPKDNWTVFGYYITVAVLGLIVCGIGAGMFATSPGIGMKIAAIVIILAGVALLAIAFIVLKESYDETAIAITEWEVNKKIHDAHDEKYKHLVVNGWVSNIHLQGDSNE